MSMYLLDSAFIGLYCALDEFAELLALGRAVARCIGVCPGLARVGVAFCETGRGFVLMKEA